MKEIDREEAERLYNSGEAGYWAAWVNPCVVHARQVYVVQINTRFFLTEPNELRIEFVGLLRLPGIIYPVMVEGVLRHVELAGPIKEGHNVSTHNTQLAKMMEAEITRSKKIQIGGQTAFHGDSIKPENAL